MSYSDHSIFSVVPYSLIYHFSVIHWHEHRSISTKTSYINANNIFSRSCFPFFLVPFFLECCFDMSEFDECVISLLRENTQDTCLEHRRVYPPRFCTFISPYWRNKPRHRSVYFFEFFSCVPHQIRNVFYSIGSEIWSVEA